MKINVEKSDLLSLISKTQNIVEKRNTMPVLANILFEAKDDRLKVFATDLEVSLTDSIPAEIDQPGQVAVNAKSIFEIVRELSEGPVQLTKNTNNWLSVKQKKSAFNIVGISSEEFPIFPTYSTKEFIKIQSDVLADMIEKTLYSVSHDETRYNLNGVYFEQLPEEGGVHYRMVATDGHRLSLVNRKTQSIAKEKVPGASSDGVIVPRKGLQEIRKLLEVSSGAIEMAVEGSQFILKGGSTLLMIRLIEGKYPNYNQLIPKNMKRLVTVSKEQLTSSLRRVSLLSNQKSKSVTLTLNPGLMQISSNNPEMGDAKEEIEVAYKGEEMKIGFNAKYLLDILNSIHDEEIKIELNDQLSPGLIRPGHDADYTCVVMPMRI
ncbi:MAG: DNA polymerase III subunit beta [Bdellovibrionales bacterium]